MSGTLFVVATPISNLEDITLRALRVMREVYLIAAEDTRRTAKLLNHYAISTPTISFHEHNSRTRVPQLLARLNTGAEIALVSDAGTPGIADPGIALVQACWNHNIRVDPVPGACAPLAAAVASGFPLEPLTFCGFVPARARDRATWLDRLQTVSELFEIDSNPALVRLGLTSLGGTASPWLAPAAIAACATVLLITGASYWGYQQYVAHRAERVGEREMRLCVRVEHNDT